MIPNHNAKCLKDDDYIHGHIQNVQVFKKLGDAGLLGVNKPVEYGGMGLDFK